MTYFRISHVLSAVALVLLAIAGCTYDGDDKAKASSQPAEAALKNPYVNWNNTSTDVSGGGTGNLNRDALKRDIDNLLLK